jgi:integrative and conjugative element protein (TIGR02256 family)
VPLSQLAKTVWIDVRALQFIVNASAKSPHLETGGSLFGWSDRVGVVVACAFGPGPAAVRTPSTLSADSGYTQELMKTVHVASEGRYRFLGSWHSHPGGGPNPSATDSLTAMAIADDPAVRLSCPTLVVVGVGRPRPYRGVAAAPRAKAYVWDSLLRQLREAAFITAHLSDRYCPP